MSFSFKNKAFTLIEMLIVLLIVAVLIGLALVAVQIGQRSSRDTTRRNDVKAVQLAFESYYTSLKQYPMGTDDTTGLRYSANFDAANNTIILYGPTNGAVVGTPIKLQQPGARWYWEEGFSQQGEPCFNNQSTSDGWDFYISSRDGNKYALGACLEDGTTFRVSNVAEYFN